MVKDQQWKYKCSSFISLQVEINKPKAPKPAENFQDLMELIVQQRTDMMNYSDNESNDSEDDSEDEWSD